MSPQVSTSPLPNGVVSSPSGMSNNNEHTFKWALSYGVAQNMQAHFNLCWAAMHYLEFYL